ncbi:hypothetical protein C8P66_11785 [Humitalea rosea]|uniref:Uncharacterized protein n=1 Tax=Humitalea rosea TaxID=990373 RepID=A0A2W7I9K1_9PROT|nr:hypothetical protein [Humitalea rosea]PZW43059.1 hypothetical protein C8P66_11785 [Humitalea rosea]
MKTLLLASAVSLCALGASAPAFAQKEAMVMFYQMQMAPSVCRWTNAAATTRLDATIAAQEQGLRVSATERATMRREAEADLRADPSTCAADGMLRMMYDEAAK